MQDTYGYLPYEKPTFGKLVLYSIQQVIVMFPATIAVALITGFQVSTTIFASGLATLCFVFITGKKVPLYYGSSFAYLSAVASMAMAEGSADQIAAWQATGILPTELISKAQFGIIMSGFVSIAAGLLVRYSGKETIEKILPPTITGSISCIIGLTLVGGALSDMVGTGDGTLESSLYLVVGLVTLLSTIFYSVYLKGFLGQLPLLLGALTGCLAGLACRAGGVDLFRAIPEEALSTLWSAGPFAIPAFSLPTPNMAAVVAIMPIAIATIPESTAHIYQLDIYVNDVAKKKHKELGYDLVGMLDKNLIGDGLCDMISGFVGGPAGTNYGENISTMAITKVFSVYVLIGASIVAMIVSCFTPLIKLIYGIPLAVIGGLEVYLFGAIAAQGIAIMIDKKVDMFSSRNIAVIACIMVIGIGGQYAFGGNIPVFGFNIPCVAGASIFGILLNFLLEVGHKGKTIEDIEKIEDDRE